MTRKTYVERNGKWVEKTPDNTVSVTPYVMDDLKPYRSAIDGSIISSRGHHRSHLRQHSCIEVGNEDPRKYHRRPKMPPLVPDIKRAIEESRHGRSRKG